MIAPSSVLRYFVPLGLSWYETVYSSGLFLYTVIATNIDQIRMVYINIHTEDILSFHLFQDN